MLRSKWNLQNQSLEDISGAEMVSGVVPTTNMEPPELRSQDLDGTRIATGEITEADVSSRKVMKTPLTAVKTEVFKIRGLAGGWERVEGYTLCKKGQFGPLVFLLYS